MEIERLTENTTTIKLTNKELLSLSNCIWSYLKDPHVKRDERDLPTITKLHLFLSPTKGEIIEALGRKLERG